MTQVESILHGQLFAFLLIIAAYLARRSSRVFGINDAAVFRGDFCCCSTADGGSTDCLTGFLPRNIRCSMLSWRFNYDPPVSTCFLSRLPVSDIDRRRMSPTFCYSGYMCFGTAVAELVSAFL